MAGHLPYLPYVPYLRYPSVVHHITLLTIGSLKFSWAREACEDFCSRLKHSISLDIVELPASKISDPKKQRDEESKRLIATLEKRAGDIWVLDERGKQMTSVQFATEIQQSRDRGVELIFILGGAYGLDDSVRKRAKCVFALSSMTLPHELCRVVFFEQLYRALEIGKGSGYHH